MTRPIYPLLLLYLVLGGCSVEKEVVFPSESGCFAGGKGEGIGILYSLEEEKVKDEEKEYRITLPHEWQTQPLAWGSLYFKGATSGRTGNNIFFLILNYADSNNTRIVFDKNANADFCDDSVFIITPGKPLDVSFTNLNDPQAVFNTRLFFRNDITDSTLIKYQRALSRNQVSPVPARYMLFNRTLNYRKIMLPDSNAITLWDYNCNGFYNDTEDRIMAGDIQKDNGLADNRVKVKNIKRGVMLPFKTNTYKLVSVDRYGNSVGLTALNTVVDTTEVLPVFRFRNEQGEKKRFVVRPAKPYTVLYVWGSWCIGCHTQSAAFARFVKEKEGLLDYYTFNYGDEEEVMKKYIANKALPFKAWTISKKEEMLLQIEGYPAYLVIDRSNRIVYRSTSISGVETFFKNGGATKP